MAANLYRFCMIGIAFSVHLFAIKLCILAVTDSMVAAFGSSSGNVAIAIFLLCFSVAWSKLFVESVILNKATVIEKPVSTPTVRDFQQAYARKVLKTQFNKPDVIAPKRENSHELSRAA